MFGFNNWAVISRLHDGSGKFHLIKELVYTAKSGTVYTVPKGFATDLASIPKGLWSIFPPHGLYLSASILHDFFCVSSFISRKNGDHLFLEAMEYSNVSKLKRYVIYLAVRSYSLIMRYD